MPVPNGEMDFSDAPDGGFDLNDIFAPNETPQNTNVVPPTQEAQATETPAEPFLKTSTGSVYKTVDDAVAGIEHKDALINQLRQQVQDATQLDPLKKKPDTAGPVSYNEDPEKYFQEIRSAKTPKELLEVQGKFVNEQMAPYAPIIASVIKSQAIEGLEQDAPKIREFLRSEDYKKTLEAFPLLKQSIEISEAYPERSGDLTQLYRMAVDMSAGRTLSKVSTQGNVSNVPAVVRPTVSSTAATPPPTTHAAQPSFNSSEGRKAIMEEQVARGVENVRF